METQKMFPDVDVEEYYIDNMTQQLVKNPERFNKSVLLSTNLFMDIISECASGHVGSIGNVYSGNYGDSYAMFEPAHGSAPKYANQNKVNPVATILSGAWMAEYLGEKHISDAIFKGTEQIINENKYVTYDLGGTSSLSVMTDAIAQRSASFLKRYIPFLIMFLLFRIFQGPQKSFSFLPMFFFLKNSLQQID